MGRREDRGIEQKWKRAGPAPPLDLAQSARGCRHGDVVPHLGTRQPGGPGHLCRVHSMDVIEFTSRSALIGIELMVPTRRCGSVAEMIPARLCCRASLDSR